MQESNQNFYRPEIDGLRAVAVIPVLLFHLGITWIPGGFIGVDVFFVISGFLITSILKRELKQGSFSFRNFWARRIRRILPAMLFVTTATLAFTYLFVFRPHQQAIGLQALFGLLSIANIYFWRNAGDYWGNAAEGSPFLHTWSLSVEEQFYLFFPVLVWLIYRFRPERLNGIISTAVVTSFILFLWGCHAKPSATFYLLPTRIWELGAGCLLAVTLREELGRASKNAVWGNVGFCMIICSYLFFSDLNGALGVAIAGTVLVLAFAHTGLCNSLLSQPTIVHIGKISYSLYLWHWPVLVLAKKLELISAGLFGKIIAVCVCFLLAEITYLLIEKPTRRRVGIVPFILLALVIVTSSALWMAIVPRNYGSGGFNNYTLETYSKYDIHPTKGLHGDVFKDGGIIELRGAPTPELLLLGDSHGVGWGDCLNAIASKHDISSAIYCITGITPFCNIPPRGIGRQRESLEAEVQLEVDKSMLKYISAWHPKVVVIACRWEWVDEQTAYYLFDWLLQKNIRVLLIEDYPYLDMPNGQEALQTALASGFRFSGERQYWPIGKFSNEIPQRISQKYINVDSIKVAENYVNGNSVLLFDGREPVYRDDDHLTDFGAKVSLPLLEEVILEILRKK
ncbi:acyltransferase [Mariniblastus sp.]|nr:acyltransferase [Mariniblastus sp.]